MARLTIDARRLTGEPLPGAAWSVRAEALDGSPLWEEGGVVDRGVVESGALDASGQATVELTPSAMLYPRRVDGDGTIAPLTRYVLSLPGGPYPFAMPDADSALSDLLTRQAGAGDAAPRPPQRGWVVSREPPADPQVGDGWFRPSGGGDAAALSIRDENGVWATTAGGGTSVAAVLARISVSPMVLDGVRLTEDRSGGMLVIGLERAPVPATRRWLLLSTDTVITASEAVGQAVASARLTVPANAVPDDARRYVAVARPAGEGAFGTVLMFDPFRPSERNIIRTWTEQAGTIRIGGEDWRVIRSRAPLPAAAVNGRVIETG